MICSPRPPATRAWLHTHTKWRAIAARLVVAGLLLTAAGLKGHALLFHPWSPGSPRLSRSILDDELTLDPAKGFRDVTFGMTRDQIIAKWGQPTDESANGRTLNYWSKGVTLGIIPGRGLVAITCHSKLSSGRKAEDFPVNIGGIRMKAKEADIVARFGKPSRRETVDDAIVMLHYASSNLTFHLYRDQLVMVFVRAPSRPR